MSRRHRQAEIRFAKTARPAPIVWSSRGRIQNARFTLPRSDRMIERSELEFSLEANLDIEQRSGTRHGGPAEDLGSEPCRSTSRAAVDRPIRAAAPRARIESRMVGIPLSGIRDADRRPAGLESAHRPHRLARLTERIESGRIQPYRGRRHRTSIGSLDRSRVRAGRGRLPAGFLLGAAFEEVTLAVDGGGRIENLEGQVEWLGDQLALRGLTATYDDRPLPRLDAVIEGLAALLKATAEAGPVRRTPPALDGFDPLRRILRRDPSKPPPIRAVGLAIDELQHPIVRWPMRDLRVLIEPLRDGFQLNVREGSWGGAPITGELLFLEDQPSPKVSASLRISESAAEGIPEPEPDAEQMPPIGDDGTEPTHTAAAAADEIRPHDDDARWAWGRFELELIPEPKVPLRKARGHFRLDGGDLVLNEVGIELERQGEMAARGVLDLTAPERVDLDLTFALTDGRLEDLDEWIALPPDIVTGDVRASGSLTGPMWPGQNFVAGLRGQIRVEAQEGRIKTDVPLAFRLAKATEGYNPFAGEDELRYETLDLTIDVEEGVLSTEDFQIEGPLRVYASVVIDTVAAPAQIRAVVGIFLFRTTREIIGNLPLVRSLLPGSEHGMVGAYFQVDGHVAAPDVEALELRTLLSGVPNVIKAPFKILRQLFARSENPS